MKKYLLVLIIMSAVTHFAFFGYPRSVVFDEVHFGNFSSAYSTGQYYFDIHPPLGKLLISFAGYIGGYDPTSTNYSEIGNGFVDPHYMWFRILPMLAGFILPIVIFYLSLVIGISPLYSFLAALLIIFENSILVQSRFILLDIMLVLFGFTALLFYAKSVAGVANRQKLLFLSAFFAILAFSIKWTGLSYFAIIFFWELIRVFIIKKYTIGIGLKSLLKTAAVYIFVGVIVYSLIFVVHLKLLPKSGPGDAFMTKEFQKTLIGNSYENDSSVKSKNLFFKIIELNKEMFIANSTLNATHQYGSKWYTWPFMMRGIYYWNNPALAEGQGAMIYLLGNPIVYWLSTLFTALLLMHVVTRLLGSVANHKLQSFFQDYKTEMLLAFAFLINFLPFAFISRVAFLYHYQSALVMTILIAAFMFDKYIKTAKVKVALFFTIIIVCGMSFLYFSPLSYGIQMNNDSLQQRFWFESWR